MIENYFYLIAICSAFVAGIYLLLTKWRVITYLQGNGRFGVNKLASCLLCVCFWIAVILNLLPVIYTGDWLGLLIIPLPAAALARFIIN